MVNPLQADTDAALARRIQKGDDDAFAELVARYQDRIYRLAKGMLYRDEAAEDAAQEVFIRAYTGLGRFRFGSSVYTWLYATLRNVCHELNRRATRDGSAPEVEISDERNEPARIALANERLERALQRIRALPERQRDVVLLRIFEGLSVAETAKVLRCREGTVKSHLHRAMKALKESDSEFNLETE